MRNLPRFVSLSLIALPVALMLSACGGDSASGSGAPAAGTSGVPAGNAIPTAPQAAAPAPAGAPGEAPPAPEAGENPVQPTDYKPDPTYLPDDSHLGAVS